MKDLIKKFRLFVNDNDVSNEAALMIKNRLVEAGFVSSEKNYDLAIAVGGDGAFLRMVKETNFSSDILYVGINSGTLGFLQEVKIEELDRFVLELKIGRFKIEEIDIQKTVVDHVDGRSQFYSLNEIVVRNSSLKVLKSDIYIGEDYLEKFIGDGVLIASSTGSTAYNLSFGGSIVYNTFSSLQITPIAPINSKVYRTLVNSVIVPKLVEVSLVPENDNHLLITIDGENNYYNKVARIETFIGEKKIKCLRLSHYNFPQKINEKLLTG